MSEGIVARRYAGAFFDLMQEKGLLAAAEEDLERVVRLVEEVNELQGLLAHQGLAPADKKAILQRLFDGQVQPLTMNFLRLLCDRQREVHLPEIYRHFHSLANEARGIAEVEVRSAIALSEEQVQALKERLARFTGREIILQQRLEPSLLGGLVVKIGDRVFDGSIAQRLNRLKEHIKSVNLEAL